VGDVSKHQLAPEFQEQVEGHGFTPVGRFEIENGRVFKVHVDRKEAENWQPVIYAFVGFGGGGKFLRIGKTEGRLRTRLDGWERDVSRALSREQLHDNEMFKGATPPWEAEGWLEYTAQYGGGLLFARHSETREEMVLVRRYNPPLNNNCSAGRARKAAWRAQHGWEIKIPRPR
jgi:hypothetical protein